MPSVARAFSVTQAAHLTGVPAPSVNFWSGRAKLFEPEVSYRGRGSRKLFSEGDLVRLRVIHLLTQRWISLKTIRALMTRRRLDWFSLRQSPWGPIQILVCRAGADWELRSGDPDPETGHPTRPLRELWQDIQRHEDLLVVNLARVKAEILARV